MLKYTTPFCMLACQEFLPGFGCMSCVAAEVAIRLIATLAYFAGYLLIEFSLV